MKIGNSISQRKTMVRMIMVVLLLISGCKKLIEVDLPIDKNTAEEVYSNSTLASYALTSIYSKLAKEQLGNGYSFSLFSSIMADEVVPLVSFNTEKYFTNNYDINSGFFWNTAYLQVIYPANSLIEGIQLGKVGIAERHLIGEAKFIRAWMYFYLVNYYGDVPLVISTDFKKNANISRTEVGAVYDQIVKDLIDAQNLLSDDYLQPNMTSSTNDRVRPNKTAATALLARVYLFRSDWLKAEIESSKVIDNSGYRLVDLDEVFVKNSKETIWALQPSISENNGNVNTLDGRTFNPSTSRSPRILFKLSDLLYNDFEPDDKRKTSWISAYNNSGTTISYPYKYKIGNKDGAQTQEQNEYTIVLRLSEQLLIRAEARAHLGRLHGTGSANEDLNKIRQRAGLESIEVDEVHIYEEILKERRCEFFTEFGHRWLDLKRTNMIDVVMNAVAPTKNSQWNSFKALLPIPSSEFKSNPALRGHQNPGYNEF